MGISLTGIILITIGIIAIIWHYAKKLHFYRAAAHFPGPRTLPIIGNAHFFLGSTNNILNSLYALTKKYPSPFRLWMASELVFVLYDPDHVKAIFLNNKANEKSEQYKLARPWLGTGLVTAPAAKAKVHRKLIEPTFDQRRLNTFIDIFNRQSLILTKQMVKHLGKGEFDILNYVSLCTLDIVCATSMGVELHAQTGNDTEFIEAIDRSVEILSLRAVRPWLYPDFIFNLTKLGRDQRKYLKYLNGVTNDVIHRKQNAKKTTAQMKAETAVPEQDTATKPFLDLMIELSNSGHKLTNEELREEVATIMAAANDTTATAGSFALYMIANSSEVQRKVYEELCEVLGDKVFSDSSIDKEDLKRMDYLERVIKETMRLFPPAYILGRSLTGDIKIGERTLPKGSLIALSILTLHRSEQYWSDPLKFDPDRFLPEEVAKRHSYSYVPFSGGARGCIGRKYALMSLMILTATVVRRYVLIKDNPVKVQDIELNGNFVIKPAGPLPIRIVERGQTSQNINQ